jgi:hypothetical protein
MSIVFIVCGSIFVLVVLSVVMYQAVKHCRSGGYDSINTTQ